jgi:TRAP-type C4-dicarboxylate transport system permease small subunit
MKIIKYAESFVRISSMVLLVVLLVIVSVQVFSRFIFGVSFAAFEELMMVLIAWCAMMCTAYAVRKKGHIAVDYFAKKMPSAAQDILSILIDFTLFSSIGYTLKFAFEFVQRRMKIPMALLPVPNGVIFLSYVVAMFFICVFLLDDIVQKVKHFKGSVQSKEKKEAVRLS